MLDYQVAQKLHACSDTHDPPAAVNDRVRDVVDLVLLKRAFFDAPYPPTLRLACVDIFVTRAAEASRLGEPGRAWPITIVAHHHWRNDFQKLGDDLLPGTTIDAAVGELNEWIRDIDGTT